jgi:hypothetical protein
MKSDRCDEGIKRIQFNQVEFDGLTGYQVWPVNFNRVQFTGDAVEIQSLS